MNLSLINIAYAIFGASAFILIMGSIYMISNEFVKMIRTKKFEMGLETFMVFISWVQLIMIESIQKNSNFYIQAMVLTFILLFLANFLLSLIPCKKFLIIFLSGILLIYSLAQRYVILFKGVPFKLADLKVIDTALSVASNYNFSLTAEMIIGIFVFLFIILFTMKINLRKLKNNSKKFFAILLVLYIGFITFISINKQYLELIFDARGYLKVIQIERNGCIYNLYLDYLLSKFEYPKDYNGFKVEEILENTEEDNFLNKDSAMNIICILDESLYDLNILDDLELNKDNLSFYHGLDKNTIKGNVIVSAFGGGTADSEYEFLTNGNKIFFPLTVYPFNAYIKHKIPSIVSRLEELGYNTLAFHPFDKNSWDRDVIYPILGFKEYLAYSDLEDLHKEEKLLRGNVSDEADFQKIIEFIEEKEEGERLFIYNVTIQNHSGYEEYFGEPTVYSGKYDSYVLNNYLTLVDKTDDAIKMLVEYFDNIDEPTLICIFGDHIPSTIDKVMNYSTDFVEKDEKIKIYKAPFLIHTNYDIDEDYLEEISLSYLSTLVMDYANLPKSKEQTIVQSFINDYPVVNEWGFKVDDVWYEKNELTDDLKLWRDLIFYTL